MKDTPTHDRWAYSQGHDPKEDKKGNRRAAGRRDADEDDEDEDVRPGAGPRPRNALARMRARRQANDEDEDDDEDDKFGGKKMGKKKAAKLEAKEVSVCSRVFLNRAHALGV